MMTAPAALKSMWWLIHKDLTRELRAHDTWPSMLLLGIVLVFVLAMQVDLPYDEKSRVSGGLLWLSIVFAGTLAMEKSVANEKEGGCWQALALYPIDPGVLFLSKMVVNLASLVVLELVLVPLFIALTDVSLLAQPGSFLLILTLGDIGFAAMGTLVSVAAADLRNRGGLVVALLLLPLAMPVVLASAEATGMLLRGDTDEMWWLWIQMLAVFAVVFVALGTIVFPALVEE
jgi:heme exporter protein B